MAEAMVETGISFAARNSGGDRWLSHKIALDMDYLRQRLEGEARDRFDGLPLTKQILAVRVVTELMLCVFRRTRHDPDYDPAEVEVWRKTLINLLGEEGLENVGI